jgi:predicted ATPase
LRLSKKLERLFWESEHKTKAKRAEVYAKRDLFIKSINQLFEKTNKIMKLDRDRRIMFQHDDMVISPYQLSSGEKQILLVLMNVLLQSDRPSIFFMDGPETALHLEWQEQLIDMIRQVNERAQLIIATHSPVIMGKGWSDKVVEMDTIITPCH